MSRRASNLLLAALMAFALATAHLLDVADMSHEWSQSQDLIEAQQAAQKEAELLRRAALICGNAGYIEVNGLYRCQPRKGKGQGQIISGVL